ncbi:RepB plasmid partitioning protein [Enterobacter sp. A11]|uniref:plasmid partitioning protein RepB C-terminal domain-containing protein n=1 Tax=unclassified Enterobacter TaxID=2608935 RepID=UPI00106FA621|nr:MULTISPECIES: plasmid partitioning protein RepB C-terminal domain-containing protein [unclassified Enterobacter]MBM1020211.1 ParB N-terminal domain-containing protein [Enterobacter sp. E1]MEA3561512.1 plasmid partitioning protein RepB C-terminal domain-containing protein [Enterobacter sp. GM-22]MEA3595192.1 plasmid partitioning protein RepB C-terminal domain-containing protein [Enterobacter sp. GM-31]TFF60329.1 RepB plasmid partitioning protein [Enterobacter sp. A11]
MIKQCFSNQFQTYPVEDLKKSRSLPVNIKSSTKYKQILTSITEIGLIEPVVIFIGDDGIQKILDGHLRVEALKDLGISHAHCLVSPVDEAYSYNKRVNRLTILQEQKMLRKAVESGVPVEKLSVVLGVSPSIINARLRISDGITPEVIALLAEKNISQNVFDVLRKVKPGKQLDFVTTMITLNNYSRKFALSMLHSLAPEFLVSAPDKISEDKDVVKTLARLEKEMAALQIETQNIKDEYAENNLNLLIAKAYIARLLNNNAVLHWLYDNNIEYLEVLKTLSGVDNLDNIINNG